MTPVKSDRKKLPAFFSIFWSITWFAAAGLFIAAALCGLGYEWMWLPGAAFLVFGILTARGYARNAPSLRISERVLAVGGEVYRASDIASVRREACSSWNWARTWNILAGILLIIFVVLAIGSLFDEGGGEVFAGIGDIFIPDANSRKSEILILQFKNGSTRRILSNMYHNYYQLREAIHTLTWSMRPMMQ